MAVKDNDKNPSYQDMQVSRRRARANVVASLVVATALLIAVNVLVDMATAKKPLRVNLETLGRYRLSETTKRILDQVKTPVTVTTIYTATDADRRPADYLPAVRDLLEEMSQHKSNLTVLNVTSDTGRDQVTARLRKKVDEQAVEHRQFINDFQTLAGTQIPRLEQLAQTWGEYPANGWLTQFGAPRQIQTIMKTSVDELTKLSNQVKASLGQSTLPDYAQMVNNVADALGRIRNERLEKIRSVLRELAKLPGQAQTLRPELMKNIDTFEVEMNRALADLGCQGFPTSSSAPATTTTSAPTSAPTSQPCADPAEALTRFAQACRKISLASETVARNLESLNEGPGYARATDYWLVEGGPLPDLYRQMGQAMLVLGEQAQGTSTRNKVEVQAEFLDRLRKEMPKLLPIVKTSRDGAVALLDNLTNVDDTTQALMAEAQKEDYYKDLLDPLASLLDRAAKLPILSTQTDLIDRARQDNVVLVEANGKVGVVTFDEAWPLAGGRSTEGQTQAPQRVFYGDMAIGAKILNLTTPPLAEVVFVYFEDVPPQQFWQQTPPIVGSLPMMYMSTLRERMVRANLEISEWNLAKQKEPPAPKPGQKQVLMVLPFPDMPAEQPPAGPEARPQVKTQDLDLVGKLIDSGTPAIFLTGYVGPQYQGQPPTKYTWENYLRGEWNLDVKSDFRVVQAERQADNPGKYRVPLPRWDWMPLSDFTRHPVGDPLRARRFYWYSVCPIVPVAGSQVVTIEDILTVPLDRNSTWTEWASAQPKALLDKIRTGQGSDLAPEREDLLPPFALISEASKKASDQTHRVIVMGVGNSFLDDYLKQPIPMLKGETLTTEPPPLGDVDVVINSVDYLADKQEFIGAGPVLVQPIELIGQTGMILIKALFGVAWPMVMLAAGGIVMLRRWR